MNQISGKADNLAKKLGSTACLIQNKSLLLPNTKYLKFYNWAFELFENTEVDRSAVRTFNDIHDIHLESRKMESSIIIHYTMFFTFRDCNIYKRFVFFPSNLDTKGDNNPSK